MILQVLKESLDNGELLLRDGGLCRFHRRRDGTVVIYEILSTKPGAGQAMLRELLGLPGVRRIAARCPVAYDANAWYERRGFRLERTDATRKGTLLNVWVLDVGGA